MNIVPFEDLDKLLARLGEAGLISSDSAYTEYAQNSLAHPTSLPADPFSQEYRDIYLNLYKKVSERSQYTTDNEQVDMDVEERTFRPFPYYSKSLNLASQHYSLMGGLMRFMGEHLGEGGNSILECGVGYGNTTLALSMLGHQVTALDINPNYCEVVKRRAALMKTEVEVVNDDFFWITRVDRQFDAVVFFESFHHCWEFERLLRELHRALKPGGRIYFGAEPINDEFPTPWGVRLDGESLLMARAFGWMELGFHNDFFQELLTRTGWMGTNPARNFWVAERRDNPLSITVDSSRIGSHIGTKEGGSLVIQAPTDKADHFALFGPYVYLSKGRHNIEIHATQTGGPIPLLVIDVCYAGGTKKVYDRTYKKAHLGDSDTRFSVDLPENATDVEIRLKTGGGGDWKLDVAKVVIASHQ